MILNILFYLKNFIFKNRYTPKEIRKFICFMCGDNHTFPFTSKDYMCCNPCLKTLADKEGYKKYPQR